MKKLLLLVGLVVAVTGCQKHNSPKSSSTPQSPVPANLNPALSKTIQQAKAVVPVVQDQFKADLKMISLKIPRTNLVFGYEGAKADLKTAKALAVLDHEGKANLQKIKKNCQVVPAQNNSNNSNISIKSNTTVKVPRNQSIVGEKCLIEYASNTNLEYKFGLVDNKNGLYSAKFTSEHNFSLRVKDLALKKKLRLHGYDMQGISSGTIDNIKTSDAKILSGARNHNIQIHGKMYVADGTVIQIEGQEEKIQRETQDDEQGFVKFKYPQGELTIGYIKTKGSKKYFVNGETYNSERFVSEYGFDLFED